MTRLYSMSDIEGKCAIDAQGVQHVTETPGTALCGAETLAYPLNWDTRTAIHCRACLDTALRLVKGAA